MNVNKYGTIHQNKIESIVTKAYNKKTHANKKYRITQCDDTTLLRYTGREIELTSECLFYRKKF